MPRSSRSQPPLLARVWQLRVVVGAVSVLVGVLVLAWPGRTLVVVAVLFGIELAVLGLLRTAAALAVPMSPGLRVVALVLGLLTIGAGVSCFLRPGGSLVVLAVFFAAGFVADGVSDLAQVRTAAPPGRIRLVMVVSGVLTIAAGLVVAIVPGVSLVLLAQVAGVVLVVVGIVQITLGLAARPAVPAGEQR